MNLRLLVLASLFLALLLPAAVIAADGKTLDEAMNALEYARDWEGMQGRMAKATPEELASEEGWLWQAQIALMLRDRAKAESLLAGAQQLFPDSGRLELLRTGVMLLGLNDVGAVGAVRLGRRLRQGLERAVALDPDSTAARIALIQYYLNAPRVVGGGVRRADEHIDHLKTISMAAYFEVLAQRAAIAGDWANAVTWMQQAFHEQPNELRALSLGTTLQMAQRFDEARAQFQALIEDNPGHGGGWYQLGRTSVLAERWLDEGRAAFEQFLALPHWPNDPSPAAAWWRIGQLEALDKSPEQARAAFEQALSLDPEFGPAQEALSEIQR